MSEIDSWTAENNRFYEKLVDERGEGHQAFWGSAESQSVRYDVFLRSLKLEGASVLDVGCAFGDFWDFLQTRKVSLSRYLGVDLDEKFIASAKTRHPGVEFDVLNVITHDPPFKPDFIVASGITAVKFDSFDDYVIQLFKRFDEIATTGFALNFLSTCAFTQNPDSKYSDPKHILGLFQKTISWRCNLIHDYRPNDFTLVYVKA